jgi:hypothetical protein
MPLVRLVYTQTTVPKGMGLLFQISPTCKPGSHNLDVRPARDFVANLNFVQIAARRWPKRTKPSNPIAAVRGAPKLWKAGAHKLILLHRSEKFLP